MPRHYTREPLRCLLQSAGLTMWYQSNTERVLWPVTSMARRSERPESTKFRTAVRRKSCQSIGPTFARRQAPCHARRTLPQVEEGSCDARTGQAASASQTPSSKPPDGTKR